jgi:hypothetical protein
VFEFHRNSALDARNFFDAGADTPHFIRNQFGFTLGGPIVKDKTFFFGSYEGIRQRLTTTEIANVPDDNAINGFFPNGTFNLLTRQFTTQIPVDPDALPYLAAYPRPNGRNFGNGFGEFIFEDPSVTNEDYFMIKIDHNFSDSDSLFVRYTLSDSDMDPFYYWGIGPEGRGFSEFITNRYQIFTLNEKKVISPTMINDFNFGFNRNNPLSDSSPLMTVDDSLKFLPLPDRTLGSIVVSETANWGISPLAHLDQPLNRFEIKDSLIWTRGRHSLKFGFAFTRLQFNLLNGVFAHGMSIMGPFSMLLQAQPLTIFAKLGDIDPPTDMPPGFERNVGGALLRLGYRESIFGFYAQDDFKWTSNFTLNLGLRYEFYKNPTEVGGRIGDLSSPSDTVMRLGNPVLDSNPSLKNFAPRIGLAWDPFGDGKTSIRAAGGIFYDLIQATRLIGPQTQFPFFSKVTPLFPQWPNFLDGVRESGIESFKDSPFVYGNPKQSYIAQYNLTIQREILPETVVTVGYAGSRGIKLSRLVDANIAPHTVQNGRYFWPEGSQRANPTWNQVRMYFWDANSFFNSLRVGIKKRFNRGFQFQSSYTWSKVIDEASNTANSDAAGTSNGVSDTPFDRKVDRARATFDIRHVYSANFTYELPFGSRRAVGAGATGVAGALISGWQISGLVSLNSGSPINVRVGFDRARQGVGEYSGRPDLVPGADPSPVLDDGRNPDQYYDFDSFVLQPEGFWGTAARNTIDGPGVAVFDLSFLKDTEISEAVTLQFRAEMFNLFNRANFRFGTGGSVLYNSPGPPNPAAGRITETSTTSRQIQLALKLIF